MHTEGVTSMARSKDTTARATRNIGATSFDVPTSGPYKKYVKRQGFYCWYDGQFLGSRDNPLDADKLLTEHAYTIARLDGWAAGYREAMQDMAGVA